MDPQERPGETSKYLKTTPNRLENNFSSPTVIYRNSWDYSAVILERIYRVTWVLPFLFLAWTLKGNFERRMKWEKINISSMLKISRFIQHCATVSECSSEWVFEATLAFTFGVCWGVMSVGGFDWKFYFKNCFDSKKRRNEKQFLIHTHTWLC